MVPDGPEAPFDHFASLTSRYWVKQWCMLYLIFNAALLRQRWRGLRARATRYAINTLCAAVCVCVAALTYVVRYTHSIMLELNLRLMNGFQHTLSHHSNRAPAKQYFRVNEATIAIHNTGFCCFSFIYSLLIIRSNGFYFKWWGSFTTATSMNPCWRPYLSMRS